MVITLSHTFTIQNLSYIEQVDTFKLPSMCVSREVTWKTMWPISITMPILDCTFCDSWKGQWYPAKTLRFYIAVICPFMEYAVPVWHTDLTAELAESLESVQKRASRIIFGGNSVPSQILAICHSESH